MKFVSLYKCLSLLYIFEYKFKLLTGDIKFKIQIDFITSRKFVIVNYSKNLVI